MALIQHEIQHYTHLNATKQVTKHEEHREGHKEQEAELRTVEANVS
ncbi:MAG: hypothetical protein ACYS8I_05115 [Planctomycetota bacterium]